MDLSLRAWCRRSYPEARLRSAEEAAYHRMLVQASPRPAAVLATVARWTDR